MYLEFLLLGVILTVAGLLWATFYEPRMQEDESAGEVPDVRSLR
jgi:hypothetical protein